MFLCFWKNNGMSKGWSWKMLRESLLLLLLLLSIVEHNWSLFANIVELWLISKDLRLPVLKLARKCELASEWDELKQKMRCLLVSSKNEHFHLVVESILPNQAPISCQTYGKFDAFLCNKKPVKTVLPMIGCCTVCSNDGSCYTKYLIEGPFRLVKTCFENTVLCEKL